MATYIGASTGNALTTNKSAMQRGDIYIDSTTGLVYYGARGGARTAVPHGLVMPITTKTANYTASVSDAVIVVNAASKTVTLPDPATVPVGRRYTVKNGASGATTTVAAAAGTIDGAATDTSLSAAYAVGRYQSDGTVWYKV